MHVSTAVSARGRPRCDPISGAGGCPVFMQSCLEGCPLVACTVPPSIVERRLWPSRVYFCDSFHCSEYSETQIQQVDDTPADECAQALCLRLLKRPDRSVNAGSSMVPQWHAQRVTNSVRWTVILTLYKSRGIKVTNIVTHGKNVIPKKVFRPQARHEVVHVAIPCHAARGKPIWPRPSRLRRHRSLHANLVLHFDI